MSDNELVQEAESQQLLEETVFNEKTVVHPKMGNIRLRMPTLALQRKVENNVRAKRKYLLSAEETIEDPESPTGVRKVRAFKSRDALLREYDELGWWTKEQEAERKQNSDEQVALMAELEMIGFVSEESIFEIVGELMDKMIEHYSEITDDELDQAMVAIQNLDVPLEEQHVKTLLKHATSTDVDDWLDDIKTQRRLYDRYVKLMKLITRGAELELEYGNLFSDSWQEQLQYSQRLAQVFYFTEKLETGEPLWSSIQAIEEEPDLAKVRWVFAELNAFWQGITDEARDTMGKYDFFSQQLVQSEDSENLLDSPTSKPDGSPAEKMQVISLEATDTPEPSLNDS